MPDVTAHITIQGTRSLLWHHFGLDAIPLQAREKTGKAGNDPSEWKRTVLVTSTGQLYLEPSYLFGAIREGAKHAPRKRGTFQPLIEATLEVVETHILVDRRMPKSVQPFNPDSPKPVYIDVRGVRNPSTRAMNIRYRIGTAPGWTASFTLRWDNSMIGEDQMQSILIFAGKFAGIGSGRKLGLGRFAITAFNVIPPEDPNAKKKTTPRDLGPNPGKRVAKRSTAVRTV